MGANHAKGNAGAEARLRMFIRRDLGWLEGFPSDAKTWVVAPLGEEVVEVQLDRELLHRSTRTINMLLREFPKALPRLVGDVAAWAERRKALMDLVKDTVHGQEPLPANPTDVHPLVTPSQKRKVAKTRAALPDLSSVVTAFEWAGWTDPETLCASLEWLGEHARQIRTLTTCFEGNTEVLCLRLWQLSRKHGNRRVTPLLTFLGQPELWTFSLTCDPKNVYAHAARIAKKSKDAASLPPLREVPRLPARVTDWILWLATQDARTQRKGLELFPLLMEGCNAGTWAVWWRELESVLREAARIPEPTKRKKGKKGKKEKDPNAPKRAHARKRIEQLAEETPPAWPAKKLSVLLRALPSQEQDGLLKTVQHELARWPTIHEGTAVRVALAHHWWSNWSDSSLDGRAAILRLVTRFCAYARDSSYAADALEPWAGVWRRMQTQRGRNANVDDDILEDLRSGEALETFFRILRKAGAANGCQADLLVRLCATFPKEAVAGAYAVLRDTPAGQHYFSDDILKFAASVASDRPERLPALLTAWMAEPSRYAIDSALRSIFLHFEHECLPDTILAEIEQGRMRAVVGAAFKYQMVINEGVAVPCVPRQAPSVLLEWMERYASELRPAITRLGEFDEDAQKTARRILGKDFPDPEALRRELATLEPQTSDPMSESKRRRANGLRARLDSSASPSHRRLERLRSKLADAREQKAFEGWVAALDDAYRRAVCSYLNVECAPVWAEDSRVIRALLPIARLEPVFQALARTLLQRRAGAKPWDLRERQQNRAFLATMKAKGVDTEAWLAERNTAVTTRDGTTLNLSLERDPLEIFHMGGHFDTCLAPGAFNYFSVIANAVDINKQVLFARDAKGRVFGRQLLALTDDGGLLAFHPYAHSQQASFREITKDFVTGLAKEMGTLAVSAGRVSTLVAPRWYDDGPVDFTREHAALQEGSAFRRRLKEIDAAHFVDATIAALDPLPLNELTFPRVLALPELIERPELVVPLMPLAKRTALSLSTLLAFTELLIRAGARSNAETAAVWIHEVALKEARREHDEHWPMAAAALLVQVAPVRALDLLKRTRPKDVRRWADDWDTWRLRLVAQAHARLGRKNKAIKFYEMAMERYPDPAFELECRAAMAELLNEDPD